MRVTEVKRPSRYYHKFPSTTGNSEYSRKYMNSIRHYSMEGAYPDKDRTGSLVKFPDKQISNFKSTYNVKFV